MNDQIQRVSNRMDSVTIETKVPTLRAGTHFVKCGVMRYLHDGLNPEGAIDPKKALKPWVNNTVQVALPFSNKEGVFFNRFPMEGFVSAHDANYVHSEGDIIMSSSKTNDDGSVISYDEQYVCRKNTAGELERVISEKKTATCQENAEKFLGALGLGSMKFNDAMALVDGKETYLKLKEKNGKIEFSYVSKKAPAENSVAKESSIVAGDTL